MPLKSFPLENMLILTLYLFTFKRIISQNKEQSEGFDQIYFYIPLFDVGIINKSKHAKH